MAQDWSRLPSGLPVPADDGAAAHLVGLALPGLSLRATDGPSIRLDQTPRPTIVYAYPRTGRPGEPPLVEEWDSIPGARGCTPESCGFRDHHTELAALGFDVYGLSTQTTDYQSEAVDRLGLPFPLLSDADLALTRACRLPAMEVAGQTLLQRQTWLVRQGRIEHVWYPVFPPDTHAAEVLDWLQGHYVP